MIQTNVQLETVEQPLLHLPFLFISKNPNIKYLCYMYQEKLKIYPSSNCGCPLNFNIFMTNDIKDSILNKCGLEQCINSYRFQREGDCLFLEGIIPKKAQIKLSNLLMDQDIKNHEEIFGIIFPLNSFNILQRIISKLYNLNKLHRKNNAFISQFDDLKNKDKFQRIKKTCQSELRFKKNSRDIQINRRRLLNQSQRSIGSRVCLQKVDDQIASSQTSKIIYNIKNIKIDESKKKINIVGGVSNAQKLYVNTISYTNGEMEFQEYEKYIIKKSLKIEKGCDSQLISKNLHSRFRRELNILRILQQHGPKSYLMKYYIQENSDHYFIQYAHMSLNDFLKNHRKQLGLSDLLKISTQIIKIVKDLHKCGIVHRDLKPDNFMINYSQKSKQYQLKLIDFSDSAQIGPPSKQFPEPQNYIYGTIPYSPIQTDKSNKNYRQKGLTCKQIDYWSVGILIHIIIYGNNPISFSRHFWKQINLLWQIQFLSVYRKKNQHNLGLLDQFFHKIICSMIKVNQEERMNLETAQQYLQLATKHYQNLLKLQFNFDRFQDIKFPYFQSFQ